jgi:hypothetical protein
MFIRNIKEHLNVKKRKKKNRKNRAPPGFEPAIPWLKNITCPLPHDDLDIISSQECVYIQIFNTHKEIDNEILLYLILDIINIGISAEP